MHNSNALARYCATTLALTLGLLCAWSSNAAPPILVLNSLNANVSVIDPVTYKEIKRVPVGKEPHHLYLTPDNKSVMVANAAGDSITFLDPNTGEVQRTLKNILDPYHLRFSPDMKWFVTAANRLNHVDIYRWENKNGEFQMHLVKRLPAGKTPSHIAIDSKSTTAYFTLQDSHELMAVDLATQKPLWTISTGKTPADLYLAPDDKTLLIGLTGASEVEVYDVAGAKKAVLTKRIPTGEGAHAFRSQGDKRHVFVSNRSANTISRIDVTTLSVVDTYKTPAGPDCMEMLADGKTLLFTARWAGKLVALDIEKKTITQQVPVGKSPHGVWTLNHASRL
ncbi:MAG: hypothetical protein CK528_10270 [Alcaligenaceae bacterium]|nr:MAG: hypothetical protein CK528_10270 [Alcaligenaceae bacterium]